MSRSFKIAIAVLAVIAAGFGYFMFYVYSQHAEHHSKSEQRATNTLGRMVDGVQAYWKQHRSFPANTGYTPALHSCCKSDDPPSCSPSAEQWNTATWQALGFRLDKPNAYSYAFDTTTANGATTFTARARGDLDCDELMATYEIYGQVGGDGTLEISPTMRMYELE